MVWGVQQSSELEMMVISGLEGQGLVGLALEATLTTMVARRTATTATRRWDGAGRVEAGGDRHELEVPPGVEVRGQTHICPIPSFYFEK